MQLKFVKETFFEILRLMNDIKVTMQRLFFYVLILFLSIFQLSAQEETEIMDDDSSSVKIFIAAGLDFGTVYNNNNAYQINISGGFDYNSIYIGGFGSSIINTIDVVDDTLYDNMQLDLGFGGFELGYELFSDKKITIFPFVQTGWGVLSLSKKNDKKNNMERIYYDNVFLINPTLQIGYKLAESFSVNIGASYHIMTGLTTLDGFSNNDFSGINYGVALKYHL